MSYAGQPPSGAAGAYSQGTSQDFLTKLLLQALINQHQGAAGGAAANPQGWGAALQGMPQGGAMNNLGGPQSLMALMGGLAPAMALGGGNQGLMSLLGGGALGSLLGGQR